jgi:hypothetical protein
MKWLVVRQTGQVRSACAQGGCRVGGRSRLLDGEWGGCLGVCALLHTTICARALLLLTLLHFSISRHTGTHPPACHLLPCLGLPRHPSSAATPECSAGRKGGHTPSAAQTCAPRGQPCPALAPGRCRTPQQSCGPSPPGARAAARTRTGAAGGPRGRRGAVRACGSAAGGCKGGARGGETAGRSRRQATGEPFNPPLCTTKTIYRNKGSKSDTRL